MSIDNSRDNRRKIATLRVDDHCEDNLKWTRNLAIHLLSELYEDRPEMFERDFSDFVSKCEKCDGKITNTICSKRMCQICGTEYQECESENDNCPDCVLKGII